MCTSFSPARYDHLSYTHTHRHSHLLSSLIASRKQHTCTASSSDDADNVGNQNIFTVALLQVHFEVCDTVADKTYIFFQSLHWQYAKSRLVVKYQYQNCDNTSIPAVQLHSCYFSHSCDLGSVTGTTWNQVHPKEEKGLRSAVAIIYWLCVQERWKR